MQYFSFYQFNDIKLITWKNSHGQAELHSVYCAAAKCAKQGKNDTSKEKRNFCELNFDKAHITTANLRKKLWWPGFSKRNFLLAHWCWLPECIVVPSSCTRTISDTTLYYWQKLLVNTTFTIIPGLIVYCLQFSIFQTFCLHFN